MVLVPVTLTAVLPTTGRDPIFAAPPILRSVSNDSPAMTSVSVHATFAAAV